MSRSTACDNGTSDPFKAMGIACAGVAWLTLRLPTSFIPNEDQGNVLVNVQLPPGATVNRTRAVMEQVEAFMLKQPEVRSMVSVLGFSFSGQGQNAALAFVTLKDWSERTAPGSDAQSVAGRAFGALSGIRDAFILTGLVPPDRIPELLLASDAVIHPSLREGLARVIPQALLVGRPVISYDIDGAREVVLPETGVLLPPRDLEGLTTAVLRLAADPTLRDAMGQEGRRRFAEQFRHETMTRQLRSLYERLLEGRPLGR